MLLFLILSFGLQISSANFTSGLNKDKDYFLEQDRQVYNTFQVLYLLLFYYKSVSHQRFLISRSKYKAEEFIDIINS